MNKGFENIRSYLQSRGNLPRWIIPNDPILSEPVTFKNICTLLTRFTFDLGTKGVFYHILRKSSVHSLENEKALIKSMFSRMESILADKIIGVIQKSNDGAEIDLYALMFYRTKGVATTQERKEEMEKQLKAEEEDQSKFTVIKYGIESEESLIFMKAFNAEFF